MPEEAIEEKDSPEEANAEAEEAAVDETPLERAERESGEYLEKWQRAHADYQNLKRRTHEDIQGAVRRERTGLLAETLMVLDYLDMALAAPCETEEAKNLLVGVQMTRDQLWSMFEREGVSPIETDGAFDPDVHQAVSTVTDTEHEPGTIVEVVRRGFKMGDGVLRYAQVKVAAEPEPETVDAPAELDGAPEDSASGDANVSSD